MPQCVLVKPGSDGSDSEESFIWSEYQVLSEKCGRLAIEKIQSFRVAELKRKDSGEFLA